MKFGGATAFFAGVAASTLAFGVLATNQAALTRLIPDPVLGAIISARAGQVAKNESVMRRLAEARAAQNEASGVQRRLEIARRYADLIGSSPQFGQASSKSLVLFFDYDCAPCKVEEAQLRAASDGGRSFAIRYQFVVARGAPAETAAIAALLAQQKGRFSALHEQMLKVHGSLTDEAVLRAAKAAGIDADEIETALSNGQVDGVLQGARSFAEDLGVTGTPALLINGELLTGGQDIATVERKLNQRL